MIKATHSNPPGPPPQPASQQSQPNSSQDDDNQSFSSQQIRKRDWALNVFRSLRSKPKSTNPQSTGSKSTVKNESTASAHRLSTIGGPGSIDIDHVVSNTAVKNTPSDVRSPSPLTRPRLDVFPQNVRAPAVHITLPKFGARI
ncbi:hypothetical protein BGZ96_011943, partial [Linnemannia gamsii]